MMLGDKISADEAEQLGMIYKVFPENIFLESVHKLADTLAHMPTYGLAMTKKALNESLVNDLTTQLAVEDHYQTLAGHSHDYKEGTRAFLEKRMPVFKGK